MISYADVWKNGWERSVQKDERIKSDRVEEEFWQGYAPIYDQKNPLAPRAGESIARCHQLLQPSYHLLEIGAGTGGFTTQIAPFVRHVTIVEPSASMRDQFVANWNVHGLDRSKLSIETCKWEQIQSMSCDVVFCANALYRVKELDVNLLKMNATADRYVYIVQSMGRPYAASVSIETLSGIKEYERSDLISFTLKELGIKHEYVRDLVKRKDGKEHELASIYWKVKQ